MVSITTFLKTLRLIEVAISNHSAGYDLMFLNQSLSVLLCIFMYVLYILYIGTHIYIQDDLRNKTTGKENL